MRSRSGSFLIWGSGARGPELWTYSRSEVPILDWVYLAKGMGVPGTRVTSLEGFSKALRVGFESEGPTLVEVPL